MARRFQLGDVSASSARQNRLQSQRMSADELIESMKGRRALVAEEEEEGSQPAVPQPPAEMQEVQEAAELEEMELDVMPKRMSAEELENLFGGAPTIMQDSSQIQREIEHSQREIAMDEKSMGVSDFTLSRGRHSANAFMLGLTQFVPGALQTTAIIQNSLTNAFMRMTGGETTDADTKALYQMGASIGDSLQALFPENPEYQQEFWAGIIARGAGQMTGQVAAALTGGAVGLGVKGVFAINTALTSAMGSQYFEEALANEVGEDEAFDYMLRNIGTNAGLNALPMALMMKRVNAMTGGSVKQVLKSGFRGSVEEGLTEGVQTFMTNVHARDIFDETRNLMEGVGEGMLAGAILGSTANIVTTSLHYRRGDVKTDEDLLELDRTLKEMTEYSNEAGSLEPLVDVLNTIDPATVHLYHKMRQKRGKHANDETGEVTSEGTNKALSAYEKRLDAVYKTEAEKKAAQQALDENYDQKTYAVWRGRRASKNIDSDGATIDPTSSPFATEDAASLRLVKKAVDEKKGGLEPESSVTFEESGPGKERALQRIKKKYELSDDKAQEKFTELVRLVRDEAGYEAWLSSRDKQTVKAKTRPSTVVTDNAIAEGSPSLRIDQRSKWRKFKERMWDWYPYEKAIGQELQKGKNMISFELNTAQLNMVRLNKAIFDHFGIERKLFRSLNLGKAIENGHVKAEFVTLLEKAQTDPQARDALYKAAPAVAEQLVITSNHIDKFSQELLKSGFVDRDSGLGLAITKNSGFYIHRRFRAYEANGKWRKLAANTESEVFQNFYNYFSKKRVDAYYANVIDSHIQKRNKEAKKNKDFVSTPEFELQVLKEAQALIESPQTKAEVKEIMDSSKNQILDILDDTRIIDITHIKGDFNPKGGKLDSTDTSFLKKSNGDMVPELRAFLGAYTDVGTTYLQTIETLATYVIRRQMYDNIAKEWKGTHFFEVDKQGHAIGEGLPHGEYRSKVSTGIDSELDKLVMHSAMKDALVDTRLSNDSFGYRALAQANLISKFSKTVLSHVTMVRNVTGGLGFLMYNGLLLNPRDWVHISKAAAGAFQSYDKLDAKGKAEMALRYQELNLYGKSVRFGDMMRTLQESGITPRRDGFVSQQQAQTDAFLTMSNLHEAGKSGVEFGAKALRKAAWAYRAGDDFVRIWMFEAEKARYKRNGVVKTDEQIAEMVLDLYQNYDRIGPMWDHARRNLLLAPFVSFPVEVTRTMINQAVQARTEMNSSHPGEKRIGYQRAAGALSVISGTVIAGLASQMNLGITDEEDLAYREQMPPWDTNSTLVYTSRGDGVVRYVNTSYTNPYAYFVDPVISIIKGVQDNDEIEKVLLNSASEMMSPFFSKEIFAGALLELNSNEKASGGEIWNPQDKPGVKAQKMTMHLWNAVEPGSINSFERGIEPFVDPTSERKKADELMGLFGMRLLTLDVRKSFGFRIRDLRAEVRNARRVYNSVKFREGATLVDIGQAFDASNEAYEGLFNQMQRQVESAMLIGVKWEELDQIMEESGLAVRDRQALRAGRFTPFER